MRSYNRRDLPKWNWCSGRMWFAGILFVCLILPQAAFAAWSNDPDANTAVIVAVGSQCRPGIVYDGEGGYFVTWRDTTNYGVYAQHYDSTGTALWDEAGATVTTSDYNSQVEAVADGTGGLIISWSGDGAVYAQHLDADGLPLLGEGGIPVINGDSDAWICSDGAGGAIIMGYYEGVTRLTADGELPWGDADNPKVYSPTGDSWAPKIASDGLGGAVLVWMDYNESDEYVLCVQRVDDDGNFLWNEGSPVYLSETGYANCPRIASTGDGGALVIWYEDADGYAVFGQKINADGETEWDEGGVLIDTMGEIYSDSLDVASDGAGGGYFTWGNDDDDTLYAQYVNTSGDLAWDESVAMSVVGEFDDTAQHPRKTVEDGLGGFITAWINNDEQIKAQRCGADGEVLWGEGGAVLSNGVNIYYGPKLASNGQGGAVAVWVDSRGETGQDIYIQGISADGTLGDPGYITAPETYRHHGDNGVLCFISTVEAAAPCSGAGILLLLAVWAGMVSLSRKHSH